MSQNKTDLSSLSVEDLYRYTAVALVECTKCVEICTKAFEGCPDMCEDIKKELSVVRDHAVAKYKKINDSYKYLIELSNQDLSVSEG